jgi:hypothetical protein
MKMPASRIAARETLLAAVAEGFTIDIVKKRMWQRNVPPTVWRDEMLDLQITVDADGTLYLPENVVVIPPPRKHWRARPVVPWNAA